MKSHSWTFPSPPNAGKKLEEIAALCLITALNYNMKITHLMLCALQLRGREGGKVFGIMRLRGGVRKCNPS